MNEVGEPHVMYKPFSIFIVTLLSCVGCNRKPAGVLSTTSVTIRWTHPQIKDAPPTTISDPLVASRLYSLFDGIDEPLNAQPHDTPFYDAELTFTLPQGRTLSTKVYLPRERTFPGMWKHPSGALNYFDADKKESRDLVSILKPLLPRQVFYPEHIDFSPPVQFTRGIPDFTNVSLPISGDFPKGFFVRGN